MPAKIGSGALHTHRTLRRPQNFHAARDHNNPCAICFDEGKP